MAIERPIFILGAHKSGSSLLRSLFDGHPDLFVLPFETHVFHMLGYPVEYGYQRTRERDRSAVAFTERCRAAIHHQNTQEDRYADAINKGLFDEQRFSENMAMPDASDEAVRIEQFFKAIHAAYLPEQGKSFRRVVEKSVTHAEHAPRLQEMFPDAVFIHIVRNPYANWVALRRYKSVGFGAPLISKMLRTFSVTYKALARNRELMPNYHVIRYEDLVTETQNVMRMLCQLTGLSYNPCLLQPTKAGSGWGGNSTSDRQFSGIDASTLDDWKKHLQSPDVYLVEKCFCRVLSDYNYPRLDNKGSMFARYSGEPIGRYVYNRLICLGWRKFKV
jgi:hypothetical protein